MKKLYSHFVWVSLHLMRVLLLKENGLEGFELQYQNWLSGKAGSRHVIKDRQGHIVEDLEAVKLPQDGRDLVVSIDRKIQYLAYRELAKAVEENKAKAGVDGWDDGSCFSHCQVKTAQPGRNLVCGIYESNIFWEK